MTTVVPPPPPTPPPSGGGPLPTLVLLVAPKAFQELPPHQRVEGVVLGTTSQGKLQVETSAGTVVLDANVPLPKGAKLVLQVVSPGPPAKVHLLAIDGKPLQSALRVLSPAGLGAGAAPGVSGAAAGSAPTSAAPLAAGTLLTATLVRTLATAAPGTPGFAGVRAGAPGPGTPGLTPSGAGAPSPAQPGAPAAATGPLAALLTPAGSHTAGARPGAAPGPGSATPAGATAGATPDLAVGTRVPLRVIDIKPPVSGAGFVAAAQAGLPAPLAPGQTLTATVTGTTPQGAVMVRTPIGHLLVPSQTALAPGTVLTLAVQGTPIPPEPGPTLQAIDPKEKLLAGRTWPSMDEAIRAIAEANPQMAQQIVDTILPQANTRLAANVLFFLTALRAGDVRNWLGEAPTRTLQRTRADLIAKLGDDFQAASKLASEPVSGDWRVAVVPFYTGSEIQQVRLLLRARKDDGKDGDEDAPQETRFVVDLGLSNLGRLQLDGLVRSKDKRLDLIVRTAAPLPPSMQNDIRRLFEESNALTGMKGGLGFQAAPPNFIDVLLPPGADTRPGLIV